MGRRISTLIDDATITGTERLVGTDNNQTVNFRMSDLRDYISSVVTTNFGTTAGTVASWAQGNSTDDVPLTKIPDSITRDTELTARVQTPVPTNAVFTDTQRSDADIDARVTSIVRTPVPAGAVFTDTQRSVDFINNQITGVVTSAYINNRFASADVLTLLNNATGSIDADLLGNTPIPRAIDDANSPDDLRLWSGTQAEYDAIGTGNYNDNILYYVNG